MKTKRRRIVQSSYACRPNDGSEPGVGWNTAWEMAKENDVWVVTRTAFRSAIEAQLSKKPSPHLHFLYYELPDWTLWPRWVSRAVQLHYYLWQVGAYRLVRPLHDESPFDLAHHVTYVRYGTPSFFPLLDTPFVWGPIGGGEECPPAFLRDFGFRGNLFEAVRNLLLRLSRQDPFVRRTARRTSIALAASNDTAAIVQRLGVERVEICTPVALGSEELTLLSELSDTATMGTSTTTRESLTFLSIGRMLHWKGYHLALRAFAAARLPGAKYLLVGDGPQRKVLERQATRLNIAHQVHFLGTLDFDAMLKVLAQADVLLHPSLHDPGPTVIVQAMAAGKPVVCLDVGGPAIQVSPNTGFKVHPGTPQQVVRDIADTIRTLAGNRELISQLGKAARVRAHELFSWESRRGLMNDYYSQAIQFHDKTATSRAETLVDLPADETHLSLNSDDSS